MNWKNPNDYSYTDQLNNIGWGWEFLRRNTDYIQDYQKYLKDVNDNPQPIRKQPHYLNYTLPPGSLKQQKGWVKEWIDSGNMLETHTAETWYGRKWELKKIISPETPANSKETIIEFIFEWPRIITLFEQMDDLFYVPDVPNAPTLTLENLELIVFDISAPINDQIMKAKKLLIEKQKFQKNTGKIKTSIPNERQLKWKDYLRIIDAKHSHPPATYREIFDVLFENHSKVSDPKDKAKKNYQQAVLQTERYRNILYRKPTTK